MVENEVVIQRRQRIMNHHFLLPRIQIVLKITMHVHLPADFWASGSWIIISCLSQRFRESCLDFGTTLNCCRGVACVCVPQWHCNNCSAAGIQGLFPLPGGFQWWVVIQHLGTDDLANRNSKHPDACCDCQPIRNQLKTKDHTEGNCCYHRISEI